MKQFLHRSVVCPRPHPAAWVLAYLALAGFLAGAACGESGRPMILLNATFSERGVVVNADTNLPDGSTVDLLLMHRGRTIAATRADIQGGRLEAEMPLARKLPPSYYDVVATCVPGIQHARVPAPVGPSPVTMIVSIPSAPRSDIIVRRDRERAWLDSVQAETDRLVGELLSNLAEASQAARGPEEARFAAGLESTRGAAHRLQADLTAREGALGLALQPEAQFLCLERINHLLAIVAALLPHGGGATDPEPPPLLVLDAESLAEIDRAIRVRSGAAADALARERSLGDPDLLVHLFRGLDRLRAMLALIRSQELVSAGDPGWKSIARPLEEQTVLAREILTALREVAGRSIPPDQWSAVEKLVQDSVHLWQVQVEVVQSGRAHWQEFDELDRTVRAESAACIEGFGLDYLSDE